MSPLLAVAPGTVGLPTDDHYARNLVDGTWRFPAAPYDFEVRNPLDSTVTTVVPLSSRFDVAGAVAAATAAAPDWAADLERRAELLRRLTAALTLLTPELAALQSVETGLAPADTEPATAGLARLARRLAAEVPERAEPGVSAHVLSWGLPLAEVVAAVLPQLAVGRTAVVKPSLRAPQSAVAFAHLATQLGFPPGVVNVVQGTAEDVGAALCGTTGLALLHARGGPRALSLTGRALARTGVPGSFVRGGGNVAIVGPDADPLAAVAAAVADAVRVHSAGGPLGLPTLLVHEAVHDRVVDVVLAALPAVAAAPLPSEPVRRRALALVEELRAAGLDVRTGGAVPDDVRHRMGWVLPPTVLTGGVLGHGPPPGGAVPLGPVLDVRAWRSTAELASAFADPRYRSGTAAVWGLADGELAGAALPHSLVLRCAGPAAALAVGGVAPGWLSATPGTTRGGRRE